MASDPDENAESPKRSTSPAERRREAHDACMTPALHRFGMKKHAICIAALFAVVAASSLAAQARPGRLELAASGGWFSVSGWEAMGVRTTGGPGFQVALRYRIWGNVLLEVGGHWSDHDLAYPDSLLPVVDTTPGAVRSISIRALYVQPTVRLGSPAAALQPYLGPRFGVARWEAHRPADWDTGLIFGGVLGVHVLLTRWVALDLSGGLTHLYFAGGHRETSTLRVSLPRVQANSVSAQADVALHLPWLGR